MFITWKESVSESMFFFHPYNKWNMFLEFGQSFLEVEVKNSASLCRGGGGGGESRFD